MGACVSIAIETSCGVGGVALGVDDELVRTIAFDSSARHATQLIARLDELLRSERLRGRDVGQVYVSVGPGSFTGVRVGVTTARTLAQARPGVRCVAVESPRAVVENARSLDWERLGVILDARQGCIYARLFARCPDGVVPESDGAVLTPEEFLAGAPRPLMLLGEGLRYHDLGARDVSIPEPGSDNLHLPRPEGVWRVGRALAARGDFTPLRNLLPIYCRGPHITRPRDARQTAPGDR